MLLAPDNARCQETIPVAQPSANGAPTSQWQDIHLKIVWGSVQPSVIRGSISVDHGLIELQQNLAFESEAIGRVYSTSERELAIEPQVHSTFGGVRVRVRCQSESHLTIRLSDSGDASSDAIRVAMQDVMAGTSIHQIGSQGARIAIERPIEDRLRIRCEKNGEILEPGSVCDFEFQGFRTGLPKGNYWLEVWLQGPSGDSERLLVQEVTVDGQGDTAAHSLSFQVPDAEGALSLECRLREQRMFPSLVSSTNTLARKLEFVSFDTQALPKTLIGWRELWTVNAWNASQPSFWDWMASVANSTVSAVPEVLQGWTELARSPPQAVVEGDIRRQAIIAGANDEATLVLQSGASIAIPLGVLDKSKPHRLVLRTPTAVDNDLVVSIQGVGRDDALVRSEPYGHEYRIVTQAQRTFGESQAEVFQQHDIVFWPPDEQVFLFVTNSNEGGDSFLQDFALAQAELAERDWDRGESDSSRLLGVYLDKPLLSTMLSAEQSMDSRGSRYLESWHTWQMACSRLAQFLEMGSANLVIMKVYSDGSGIYPSDILASTPRYDTGSYFEDGRHPQGKDGLQLLLKYCERYGIKLIASLDLETAFPDLQSASTQETREKNAQFQLSIDGVADQTRYEPLDVEFQSRVKQAVAEIVQRYGGSPAFAGVQIQLNRRTQLLFRGDRWGYAPQTIELCQQQIAAAGGRWQFQAKNATLERVMPYLQWRARSVSLFLSELGQLVAEDTAAAKLYLDFSRLWDQEPDQQNFFKPALVVRNPHAFLLGLGIDLAALRESTNVRLVHGDLLSSEETVSANSWIREVARDSIMDGLLASLPNAATDDFNGGSIVAMQLAQGYTIGNADRFKQETGARLPVQIYPMPVEVGADPLHAIIQGLAQQDLSLGAVGGWLPNGSLVERQSQLFSALRQLPDQMYSLNPGPMGADSREPVVARWGRDGEGFWLQIINAAPWAETVSVTVRGARRTPGPAAVSGLGVSKFRTVPSREDGVVNWEMEVSAYGMAVLRAAEQELSFGGLAHNAAAGTRQLLDQKLDSFSETLHEIADPNGQQLLANVLGDFERWEQDATGEKPTSWSRSTLPGVTIERSNALPHSGRSSLMIHNANAVNASAWVQSRPFPVPTTGRLMVQAWLRAQTVDGGTRVRLSVVGRLRDGSRYQSSQVFGSATDSQARLPNDWGTRPATLHVADIPIDQLEEVFVAIELLGAGKVWVDDVAVFQTWLHPDERVYLEGKLLVAREQLNRGNLLPADELLGSRWAQFLFSKHPSFQDSTPTEYPDVQSTVEGRLQPRAVEDSPDDQPTAEQNANSQKSWYQRANVIQTMREAVLERWNK